MHKLARIFAALLAIVVVACVSVRTPRLSESTIISEHHLIDLKWRLTSAVFPVMPADGFPITFHSDGGLETRNLGVVNKWALSKGVLHLYRGKQGALDFRWLPMHGVFRSCQGPARPPLFVFPVGTSAMDVQRIGCTHSWSKYHKLQL